MPRFADWENRLSEMLDEVRDEPFDYGVWDCFQFARAGLIAMTGCDIAAQFNPYASRFGYSRQMVRYCQSVSLIAFADKLMGSFGMPQVSAGYAQRGDIALASDPPAFGIVSMTGRSILLLVDPVGIAELPVASALRVWRV